jgi:SAM-dependent methyltransferase
MAERAAPLGSAGGQDDPVGRGHEQIVERQQIVEVGFSRVDAVPDPAALVAGVEAIGRWPAVQSLRRWERTQLALRPRDRLLDVGCGVADVAIDLAADVVPGGKVVAVDSSQAMLDAARRRAALSPVPVRLRLGDAMDLGEAEGSFTAVRAERLLQWVPRPEDALAGMVRVLEPGGRISLIDTDWRTFAVDVPAEGRASEITDGLLRLFGDGAMAGARLMNLCRDAGLTGLTCTGATHVATSWDPDTEPGPDGLFPVFEVAAQLVARGVLDPDAARRAVDSLVDAARADRFFASLSMIAVSGVKPGVPPSPEGAGAKGAGA